LIEQGMNPWNILALTFTNKAANEMRSRIENLLGHDRASGIWMGTFHSIFARILRMETNYLNYSQNYTIYDADDSKALIKAIIREKGLDEKQVRPGDLAGKISELKNRLALPDPNPKGDDLLGNIYLEYQRRLQQSDAMDFDDLLMNTYYLLKENPEVLEKYTQKFQFMLVDEYQDTNWAQDQIVWLLTQKNQRVCVVGDDAQSIYSFRGALIDNILRFQGRYQGGKLFKLEQNYRSTETIVNAANSLINCNRRQIHKDIYSKRGEGEKIMVLESYTDKEEAKMVCSKIRELKRKGDCQLNDIAVLYRTNNQSRAIEEELLKNGTPYRIYGGLAFYSRKVVKDALAYLRLAVNPNDEESFRRVVNYPARGIGKTTLDKVFQAAVRHEVSPMQLIAHPELYPIDINKGTQNKLLGFAKIIDNLHSQIDSINAYDMAMLAMQESGMKEEVAMGKEIEDEERRENLQELMDGISSFVIERSEEEELVLTAEYLQMVSLISDLDKTDDDDTPKVTLMTIHSAKGLEFKVVFVTGLEEELFPSKQAIESHNVEEERRLCYVAMTRAMDRLFLSWSHTRIRFGHFENNERSRFLREIDKRYLTSKQNLGSLMDGRWTSRSSEREEKPRNPFSSVGRNPVSRPGFSRPEQRPTPTPLPRPTSAEHRPSSLKRVSSVTSEYTASAKLPDNQTLKVGDKINHGRFGIGMVTDIAGSGLDTKATVNFETAGTKQLLLRFAKFTKLQTFFEEKPCNLDEKL